jgi:hypothetical protein
MLLPALVGAASAGDALPDPMRPSIAGGGHTATPGTRVGQLVTLQALIGDSAARVAIVNGQLVRAGTRIGDLEIVAIEADGVRYRRHQQIQFAPLAVTYSKGKQP